MFSEVDSTTCVGTVARARCCCLVCKCLASLFLRHHGRGGEWKSVDWTQLLPAMPAVPAMPGTPDSCDFLRRETVVTAILGIGHCKRVLVHRYLPGAAGMHKCGCYLAWLWLGH